jgi:hypothetical protein
LDAGNFTALLKHVKSLRKGIAPFREGFAALCDLQCALRIGRTVRRKTDKRRRDELNMKIIHININ